ncbi:MAG: glycoside hydrolase family 25 protein, partial [Bacteroidales bacterium]|nr:glycoside hydrolase family 25 protein [Candidatus Sodaliphilus aphodohippi]
LILSPHSPCREWKALFTKEWESPNEYDDTIFGVDVSHHNKEIDWKMLHNEGNISFAYIKATEGASYVDPCFYKNIKEARENLIDVGAYHYFTMNTSGVEQFWNFYNTINKINYFDLKPVLDLEPPTLKNLNKIYSEMDKDKYAKEVNTFINLCEKYLHESPVIYCQQYHYDATLLDKVITNFCSYQIWCGIEFVRKGNEVVVKKPWSNDCVLWQYKQAPINNHGFFDINITTNGKYSELTDYKKLRLPEGKGFL